MKTTTFLIAGMLWQTTFAVLLGFSEEELSKLFHKHEIIQPMQVDGSGNFISFVVNQHIQRKRRSVNLQHPRSTMTAAMANVNVEHGGGNNTMKQLNPQDSQHDLFYYNLTAFGVSYHLELHKKRRLIAPNAKVIRYSLLGKDEGSIDVDCVHAGHIINQPLSSVVAITNCGGLAGLIKTQGDEFYIEPLESNYDQDNSSPQRHVVYRRSSTNTPPPGPDLGSAAETMVVNQRFRRHSKKKDYSMEVLLTADNEVIRFHGSEHVENYLVTLMNIVDEIYHDDSIGAHINIVLVRLCLLDQSRSSNLIINEDPSNSLKKVCKWANDMQTVDPLPSGKTYDHAIFLTRQNFGPAGYAHVTGMCHPLRSCTLNQEDGFSSAFVIAHETGHVLGMEHDGEGNKCGDEATMGSIMAPLVQAAFHRYHWSRCSQQELQAHIRKFDCLMDDPHMPDWGPVPLYPGIMYSMDDQCRFDFGKGYKRCTAFRNLDVCRTLWCSHDDNPMFCKTKNGPPVDGTECGKNMWCFQSHCIWRQQAEGWSKWSSYGTCSRSCGTGVRHRRRDCKNPRFLPENDICPGDAIEYNLCNNKMCLGSQDYRAEQCSGHKSLVYANQRHTWMPYESEHEDLKCELFCVSKETNDILSMGTPAADGTRCSYDDQHNICIDAMCVKAGCDKILGSDIREDECGVCGGDGSECHQLNGTYRRLIRRPFNSYMKMFSIPQHARKIWIQESSTITPVHMLAMKNRRTGRYILNQKNKVVEGDVHLHFIDSGAKWTYSRVNDRETISSSGPLRSEIKIMLISRGRDRKTTIHYSYILHTSNLEEDVYGYELRRWYPCSVTCGTGIRLSRFGCLNKSTGKWVRKIHCLGSPPRRIRKKCFNKCQAPPSWQTRPWGACTRSCGGGTQTRSVFCQQQDASEVWQAAEERLCESQEIKPHVTRECTNQPCQPSWRTSSWSTCGVSCGRGVRRRRVACRARGRFVSDSECNDPKPSEVESCFLGVCAENACEKDQSILCKLDTMAKYCTIPGYHQLCCKSCYTYLVEHQQMPPQKGNLQPSEPFAAGTMPPTASNSSTG